MPECRIRKKQAVRGEEELLKLIRSERGEKYDCAVSVSGGKDSSYVLYYLVKKLSLKCLALFFDNGFVIPEAKENIRRICEKLNVDLVVGHATRFRRQQTISGMKLAKYLGKPIRVCGGCENNLRSFALNEAARHEIPVIVWGRTTFEDSSEHFIKQLAAYRDRFGTWGNMPGKAKRSLGFFRHLPKGVREKAGILNEAVKLVYNTVRDNFARRAPEGLNRFNPFMEISLSNKKIKSLDFFDFVEYNPYEYIKVLTQEVGWESPSGAEARMDCKVHAVTNWFHLRDTGGPLTALPYPY